MEELSFKKISIEDKSIFTQMLQACPPNISEYTFTNLFMWSGPKKMEFAQYEEGLVLAAEKEGKRYFLPPIGYQDCLKTFAFLMDYGLKKNIREFELVPEYQKKHIKYASARIMPDRNNFDYLYKATSLATLKGWRLDGKRGFVKKFKENYSFVYKKYDSAMKKDCLELFNKWMAGKMTANPSVEREKIAFSTFLDHFDLLDAAGGVVFVEGQAVALSFGEKLNDTTFVVHFEKADSSYTGSYQMMNQLFIQNEAAERCLFVNREQDMGIEGIRKAKESYVPIRLIKKYKVTF
jgi:hypothetical protein